MNALYYLEDGNFLEVVEEDVNGDSFISVSKTGTTDVGDNGFPCPRVAADYLNDVCVENGYTCIATGLENAQTSTYWRPGFALEQATNRFITPFEVQRLAAHLHTHPGTYTNAYPFFPSENLREDNAALVADICRDDIIELYRDADLVNCCIRSIRDSADACDRGMLPPFGFSSVAVPGMDGWRVPILCEQRPGHYLIGTGECIDVSGLGGSRRYGHLASVLSDAFRNPLRWMKTMTEADIDSLDSDARPVLDAVRAATIKLAPCIGYDDDALMRVFDEIR